MPLNAPTGQAMEGEDLLEQWRQRNRCASASAWIYHVGLDAFAAGEHLRRGPRAAAPFVALLVRDVGIFQAVLRKRGGTEATTRVFIAVAALTDLLAAGAARVRVPTADFETDRAISQFGLSGGWALQLGSGSRRGDAVVSYALPVAMQVALSAIWRLRGGRQVRYVVREAAWSAIALTCVSQLSKTMREAVDSGYSSAEGRKGLFELRAKVLAKARALDDAHHFLNSALPVFAHAAEGLARKTGVPPFVATLARAEAQCRRRAPEEHSLTIEALALRMLTARPPSDGESVWQHEPGSNKRLVCTRGADRSAVAWLTEAAASAKGGLLLGTRVADGRLALTMTAEALKLPPADQAPAGCSASPGGGTVTADLQVLAARE